MLMQCPHCFTKVMPKGDGSCPACHKATQDAKETSPTRRSLRLSQGESLPGICCDCGEVTDRYFSVTCSSSPEENQPAGFGQALIGMLFSWPMALYFFLLGIQNTRVVRVRMPQCRTCAQARTPEVRHVDFGNAAITFVVHNNLYEEIVAAEKRRASIDQDTSQIDVA